MRSEFLFGTVALALVAGSAMVSTEAAAAPVTTTVKLSDIRQQRDTGGPDICDDNNGKDDTRINAISFRPLKIRLQ